MPSRDTGIVDKRSEFRRISDEQPPDPAARRAFLQTKVASLRNDQRLSPEEKEQAVADLLRQAGEPAP